jgi:hypothetical protein
VPDESIDVFLSYTHQNDLPPPGVADGWVTTLKKYLEAALRLKLPRPGPRIFLDHQLTEVTSFEQQLLDRIRAARTLVLALSPAYADSVWCARELANFLIENRRTKHADNVMVVELDRIETERLPTTLAEIKAVRFWLEDPESHVRETLGFPMPSLDDREYHRLVNRLAHRIAELLAAANRSTSELSQKPAVYVAETSDDLLRKRDQVMEFLESEGFDPVPRVDLPRDCEAAYVQALNRELAKATTYVHLFGPYEGRTPPDGRESFVRLQAAAAHERGLTCLGWRDSKLEREDVEDAAYQQLVFNHDVQASRLEEFKLELLRTLRKALTSSPSAASPVHAAADGTLKLFVKAHNVDRSVGEYVADALRGCNATPELSTFILGAPAFVEGLAQETSRIAACDGVVFVVEKSSPDWLASTFGYAERAMGLSRKDVWGAVLDLQDPDRPRISLVNPNLVTFDFPSGFDVDRLAPFLRALRKSRGIP